MNPAEEWLHFAYEGTSGERCDAALTLHLRAVPEFAEVSRARVQSLIEMGGVLIGGHETFASYKCRPGISLSVNVGLLRWLLHPVAVDDIAPVDLGLRLHHVDAHLAVVEKPPGISVHPSPTEQGPTLAAALLHELGSLSDAGGTDRPGIVHRLDKETSGLLVVARDNPTHVALSRQFAERLVEKTYLALALSEPAQPRGRIDLPIERHPYDRKRMWAQGRGRPALTEYEIAERWGPLPLLRVEIHTGRTHQIRVHLAAIGVALLSDFKYGRAANEALRGMLRGGAARLRSDLGAQLSLVLVGDDRRQRLAEVLDAYPGIFLHAHELAFTHPSTGERLRFNSAPPPAWEDVRALLGTPTDA